MVDSKGRGSLPMIPCIVSLLSCHAHSSLAFSASIVELSFLGASKMLIDHC